MNNLLEMKSALEIAIAALKVMHPDHYLCKGDGHSDWKALEAALEDVNKSILVQRGLDLVDEAKYTAKAAVCKRIDDLADMEGMNGKVVSDLWSKLELAETSNFTSRELDRKFLLDDVSYNMVQSLPDSERMEADEVRRLIAGVFGK